MLFRSTSRSFSRGTDRLRTRCVGLRANKYQFLTRSAPIQKFWVFNARIRATSVGFSNRQPELVSAKVRVPRKIQGDEFTRAAVRVKDTIAAPAVWQI